MGGFTVICQVEQPVRSQDKKAEQPKIYCVVVGVDSKEQTKHRDALASGTSSVRIAKNKDCVNDERRVLSGFAANLGSSTCSTL